MRISIEMALLVGCAAVALASPIAGGPKSPQPKDEDEVGMMVAGVGRCPVVSTPLWDSAAPTDLYAD